MENKTYNGTLTKAGLINAVKNDLVWYAIPQGINSRSKDEIFSIYCDAIKLGLTKANKEKVN